MKTIARTAILGLGDEAPWSTPVAGVLPAILAEETAKAKAELAKTRKTLSSFHILLDDTGASGPAIYNVAGVKTIAQRIVTIPYLLPCRRGRSTPRQRHCFCRYSRATTATAPSSATSRHVRIVRVASFCGEARSCVRCCFIAAHRCVRCSRARVASAPL
jgi:hypothetical protein